MNAPKPAPPKRVNCPRPDKQAFATKDLADVKLRDELAKMVARGWTQHLPTYSYPCSCTYWHWTSRPIGKRTELAEIRGNG